MADEQITDEALDEAATALLGEEKQDGENIKEEVIDKKDGKEDKTEKKEIDFEDLLEKKLQETRSDWGRKLSASEKQIKELSGMVQSLVSVMESQHQPSEEDDTIPLSKRDLDLYLEQREQKLTQKRQEYDSKYEQGYLSTLQQLTSKYDDNVATVIDRTVRQDFNIRYSDDPAADAERNFLKAKIALMEKASEKKKNPLGNSDKNLPLGGPSGSDNDFKSSKVYQLDEYAADFVKSRGLDEKFVEKALSGNAPTYISGAFAKKGERI